MYRAPSDVTIYRVMEKGAYFVISFVVLPDPSERLDAQLFKIITGHKVAENEPSEAYIR